MTERTAVLRAELHGHDAGRILDGLNGLESGARGSWLGGIRGKETIRKSQAAWPGSIHEEGIRTKWGEEPTQYLGGTGSFSGMKL